MLKKKMKSFQLLRALLFMCNLTLGTTKNCARFVFPTVNGEKVRAEENSTVNLQFQLETENCKIPDKFSITISKLESQNGFFTDHCMFIHESGACSSTGPECVCPDGQGPYRFQKTVDRHVSTTWEWWTTDIQAEKKQINIEVMYPASITSLSLPGKLHNPGDTVDVACTWKNGNPPVTAHLLDRHGGKVTANRESGDIHHSFSQVDCQDAGLIRCEAPGASHNRSTTLLVKCLPEFVGTPTVDEGGSLEVRVRSHTKTIQACKLTRTHPHDAEAGKPIDCTGNLTGTPPDLTLTVRLDNVRKEEEGEWRLELTNDVGTGHVEFKPTDVQTDSGHVHRNPYEETNTDETSSGSSPNSGVNVPLMGGVIVGVNVGTVIIVTIIVLIIVRRSRRERQPEPVEEQEMVPPPIPPPRQDPEANRLAELARRSVYDDIFADLPQGYNRQNHPLPPCPDQPPPRPPRN